MSLNNLEQADSLLESGGEQWWIIAEQQGGEVNICALFTNTEVNYCFIWQAIPQSKSSVLIG